MSHIQSPTLVPGGKDRQRQEQVEEFKMNNNANQSYEELKSATAVRNAVAQARSQQRGGRKNQGGGVNVQRSVGNNQGGGSAVRRQYTAQVLTDMFNTNNPVGNIQHDVSILRNNTENQNFTLFSTPQEQRPQDRTVQMNNVGRRMEGNAMSGEPSRFVEDDSQTNTLPTNATLLHTESSNAHVNRGPTSQDVGSLVRRIQELELQNQDLSRRHRQDQAADNDQQVSEEEEAEAQFQ